VLRSNVQLQLAPGLVMVARVKDAVGTLRVRRRLAAHAEVLVLLHALGLGHATDGAAVRDQAVFVIDPVEGTTVACMLEIVRGALPVMISSFPRLLGGLEEHVEVKQVLDLLLARGRRRGKRGVRQRVELAEDGGEGVRRSASGSEALDEELRSVVCEVWKHVCHCEFCLSCC
jgi:hypothetical protein